MANPGIPPQVERGFVRIQGEDGQLAGCGFLLSDQYVCTCAHVVNAALKRALTTQEPPDAPIFLVFPFLEAGPPIPAETKAICWSPLPAVGSSPEKGHRDIAILELKGALPQGARPLPLAQPANVWQHDFGAYGYPAEKPDGAWATGHLLHSDDTGLIQIEDTKETGYFVQQGFSGTPIWDENLGCVVGMVALAEPEPDKRVAFVIPIVIIRQTCPHAFASAITPFERLTTTPPGSPPGYRTNIRDFVGLYFGTPEEPKPFGGREAQLTYLDNWLDEEKSDRLLVVAPAGRGKSTLLVHWAARVSTKWTLVFVPISIRKRTNRPETFFQALAAHLAALIGQSLSLAPVDAAQFYQDKMREYLDEYSSDQARPLLLVLDGLDEAAGFEAYDGLFPQSRMKHVKVVVSARLIARAPDPKSWLERLGWPSLNGRSDCLDVPSLDKPGLEDVLRKMGCPLSELAGEMDVVSRLLTLTEGDPLLVGLYVEDLWSRRSVKPRLSLEDLNSISPGFGGYFRKWFDDQRQLWGTSNPLRERETLGVLAILACALGPLRASEICQLMGLVYGGEICGVPQIIDPLERFVIGNPDSEGYVLSHPKLSDFLSTANNLIVDAGILSKTKQGFLNWGRTILKDLKKNEINPESVPEYLLLYYTRHLIREHAASSDFMALAEDGWRRTWYAHEGGYSGFANDVAIAFEVVNREARKPRGRTCNEEFGFLPDQIRCALILSSIRNIGAKIDGDLLKLTLQCGLLSEQQVLNLIELKLQDSDRASSLTALAGSIRRSELLRALEIARAIGVEEDRVRALTGLAPHLPDEIRREVIMEAMKTARAIRDKTDRARALIGLAPHLPEKLRREVTVEAMQAARAIRNETDRALALTSLAPHLPEDSRREVTMEAMKAARAIRDETDRARALTGLALHLSEELRQEVTMEAMQAARAIGHEWGRALALTGLAQHLPDEIKLEALETVRAIGHEWVRALALTRLAPHLPEGLKLEALEVARAIREQANRVLVLTALAPHLPEELRREVIMEAMKAARTIRDDGDRVRALTRLAPHLPEEIKLVMLEVARAIREQGARVLALTSQAPHLPEELRREVIMEAMQAARAIRQEVDRALALTVLAPHLPEELRREVIMEAMQAARAIRQEVDRALALTALAPHLPEELRREVTMEAMQAARAIPDEGARVRSLNALAPHLPEELRREVIMEVMQTARAIREERDRALTLTDQALHLPEELRREVTMEVMQIAHAIREEWVQALTLTALAPHLPEELRREVTMEVIQAARAIFDEWGRALALTALAPHLPEELRREVTIEAMQAACAIHDERARALALAALVPHLPEELRREALERSLATGSHLERSWAFETVCDLLKNLMSSVSSENLLKIFRTFREVGDWWP